MSARLRSPGAVARSLLRTQSDARLVDLAGIGSEPAYEVIVIRYRRALVRYCARLVGCDDAEEVVQETLWKAHAALIGGSGVRELSPWLHTIAHNTALGYLRARTSRPRRADVDWDMTAVADRSLEYRQDLREDLREVLIAIRSLPDRQRDAIVMRELEGRSYDEIAARLATSHGAVRQLLSRARTSIRERVPALLPFEPLVRWMIGVGGAAEAGGGATISGGCALGAKVCVAALIPAAIAVITSAPAPRHPTPAAGRSAGTVARAAVAPTAARGAALHASPTRAAVSLPASTTPRNQDRPAAVGSLSPIRAPTAERGRVSPSWPSKPGTKAPVAAAAPSHTGGPHAPGAPPGGTTVTMAPRRGGAGGETTPPATAAPAVSGLVLSTTEPAPPSVTPPGAAAPSTTGYGATPGSAPSAPGGSTRAAPASAPTAPGGSTRAAPA